VALGPQLSPLSHHRRDDDADRASRWPAGRDDPRQDGASLLDADRADCQQRPDQDEVDRDDRVEGRFRWVELIGQPSDLRELLGFLFLFFLAILVLVELFRPSTGSSAGSSVSLISSLFRTAFARARTWASGPALGRLGLVDPGQSRSWGLVGDRVLLLAVGRTGLDDGALGSRLRLHHAHRATPEDQDG
jgi:hypothetical protein